MTSSRRLATLLIVTACWLTAAPLVLAQGGQRSRSESPFRFAIGAGAAISPRPYVGADPKVIPFPFVSLQYKTFFFEGVRLGFRGRPMEHLEISGFAQARFDGFDVDDSPALAGMDEADPSVDVGFSVGSRHEHVEIDFVVRLDAFDRSDGAEVEVDFAFPLRGERWSFTPGAGLRWQSDDLVDYLYGVSPEEASADREAFAPDDTVNMYVGAKLRRSWSSGWVFVAGFEWERFGNDVTASPIVSDDHSLSAHAGVLYVIRPRR